MGFFRLSLIATGICIILVGGVPAVFPNTSEVGGSVASAAVGDNECFRHRRAERVFTRKMNRARRARGRRRMKLDPELSRVARVHTRRMIRRRLLHHTPSWRLRRRVTRWTVLGENVGVGSTVRSLHRAFMHSRSHRANILYGRFRDVGVGARRRGGRLWVTVVFESRRNPGTRLRMPTC